MLRATQRETNTFSDRRDNAGGEFASNPMSTYPAGSATRLCCRVVFFSTALSLMWGEATKEFIYDKAPFASAHASTVVQLNDGDLMSAWFGGTKEGAPNVAIWAARRHDGKWSAPMEMAREKDIATYNPVLFFTKDGRLWLYYKFGPHPTSWTAARRYSTDEGKTWSPVEHLPAGLYGPIRAKPLLLPDGTLVSGTSVESY